MSATSQQQATHKTRQQASQSQPSGRTNNTKTSKVRPAFPDNDKLLTPMCSNEANDVNNQLHPSKDGNDVTTLILEYGPYMN